MMYFLTEKFEELNIYRMLWKDMLYTIENHPVVLTQRHC